jgi:anti-sigma B factor antagonist
MTTRIESVAGSIRVTGEMTVYTAGQIKQALVDAVTASPARVQLDLAGVSDFDTAGVQLVLLAHREALASDRQFHLIAESNIVRDVLTLFGAFGMLKDAPVAENCP